MSYTVTVGLPRRVQRDNNEIEMTTVYMGDDWLADFAFYTDARDWGEEVSILNNLPIRFLKDAH